MGKRIPYIFPKVNKVLLKVFCALQTNYNIYHEVLSNNTSPKSRLIEDKNRLSDKN